MKIVIVKESGKIKIGKKEITSPSLVKGLLKCKDLKDRARQNERTYWLRITFEETVQIIMGDFKVSKEPEHEAKIVGEVNYQVRTFKDEKIRLFIAKPDSQFKSIRTKTLKYGEEWVVMFTEIENSQTDRREIIRGLIKMMREELQRYQLDVAQDYANEMIDTGLMKRRLVQVEELQKYLERLIGRSRDLYKVANGRNVYIIYEMNYQGYIWNRTLGDVAYLICKKKKKRK